MPDLGSAVLSRRRVIMNCGGDGLTGLISLAIRGDCVVSCGAIFVLPILSSVDGANVNVCVIKNKGKRD